MTQLQTPLDDVAGGAALLAATVGPVVVLDPTEKEKTRLIEAGEPFQVDLSWSLTGILVPYFSGTWFVELFIDDLGAGTKTGSLGVKTVPYVLGTPSTPHKPAKVSFAASFTVPTTDAEVGVYQLTATLDLSLDGKATGTSEMMGFIESGPIRIQKVKNDTN